MSNYFEVSASTATFTWGTVESGQTNLTHDAISFDVIANCVWELTVLATDVTAPSETDVDIDVTNCFAWDEDGSANGNSFWVRNTETVGLGTWDAQSALSTETAITRNFYILLTTSTFFDAGIGKTWSATFTVQAQADT